MYCNIDFCARECVQTATALVASLPNCVNAAWGTNYYETMAAVIATCELGPASGSQAEEVGACSESERTATMSYLEANGRSVGGHCRTDVCSIDCVADLTTLTQNLPDCHFDDTGFNYYQELSGILATCNGTSPVVDDGSSGAGYTMCSSVQSVIVTTVAGAYGEEFATECASDLCTSSCKEISTALMSQLPDCIDAEGTYFYGTVAGTAEICGFTSSSSSDTIDLTITDGSSGDGSSTVGSVDVAGSNGAAVAATAAVSAAMASVVLAVVQLV